MTDPRPPVGGGGAGTLASGAGSKRRRRPSVRLGEIGGQPAAIPQEPHIQRSSKQWKSDSRSRHPPLKPHSKTNEARSPPSTGAIEDRALVLVDDDANHGIRRPSRNGKPRMRGGGAAASTVGRVRTNWAPKAAELRSSGEENARDEGYVEDSDGRSDREVTEAAAAAAAARARVSENKGFDDDDAPSETNRSKDWSDHSGDCSGVRVRPWLNRLGLGRYATVFEIHEVDGEVLPLLTLEDLKEMGINAVGSRRKMYCAIRKLGKNVACLRGRRQQPRTQAEERRGCCPSSEGLIGRPVQRDVKESLIRCRSSIHLQQAPERRVEGGDHPGGRRLAGEEAQVHRDDRAPDRPQELRPPKRTSVSAAPSSCRTSRGPR